MKNGQFALALSLSLIPAFAAIYCLATEHAFTSILLLTLSIVCVGMSVIAFVSYATLKHGVPALLDFIRQTLLPITQLLSRTHVIGPIVSFLVRSTFFVWFMMLLASDRLLRSILSRLVGKHASGRRFSIINAMDPDFSLFDTAPDTIHDNDLPSPTNTYYSHSLAYSLCVASKLVYEDIPIIRHELDKAGFNVSDTFKPMAYLVSDSLQMSFMMIT